MKYLSNTSLTQSFFKNGKPHICKMKKEKYKYEQISGTHELMNNLNKYRHIK